MSYKGYDPMDYVDICYSKEKYLECYSHGISPINGQNMWPPTSNEEVLPPIYKKGPGRPKKLRRREIDEEPNPTKLKRQNTQYRCTKCNKLGHNSRGCKSSEVSQEAQKRKRKPKKTTTDDGGVSETVTQPVSEPAQHASATVPAAAVNQPPVHAAADASVPVPAAVLNQPPVHAAADASVPVPAAVVQEIRRVANTKKRTSKEQQFLRPKLGIRRKIDVNEATKGIDNGGHLTQESTTTTPMVKEKGAKYLGAKYNLRKKV